jgi:hypothetical protein
MLDLLGKSQPHFACFCSPSAYTVPSSPGAGEMLAAYRVVCRIKIVRVTVTTDNPERVVHSDSLDLRNDPGAIARIDAARRHPSLRGLLLNLNEDESPFSTLGCKVWSLTEGAGAESSEFASRIDLVASQGAQELDEARYHDLAHRLAELLEREPGDALRVEVQILSAQFAGGRQGFCLRLLLFSRGAGQEQAQMRWSLGLARVQQALLFLARALRHGRLD